MAASNDSVSGDPIVGFHFVVQIGKVKGYFTSVSGMGSESAVIDHKIVSPSASEPINRKLPGRLSWGEITLKRGVTTNMDFWTWRQEIRTGQVASARQDGSIMMYDQEGNEVARWDFEKAWPIKVSGPDISADDDSVAMEEVVLVHEYIKRTT